MKTFFLALATIFILGSASGFSQETTASIEVHIQNIKSDKGTLRIGLYQKQENFLGEAFKSLDVKANSKGVTVTFENIEPGEYAISLYHDKDDNEKLNTFLKMPTEPYGTSNNAKGQFGPPKWADAKFTVSDQKVAQTIKL